MKQRTPKLLPIITAFLIVAASFYFGLVFGVEKEKKAEAARQALVTVENIDAGKPENVDFSLFWDVWKVVNEKYVSDDGPTDQEKVYGAISGMVKSLGDPYSVFFPPKESEYFESEIRGDFSGVGMEIGIKDDILTVIAPLKGTPAERAGIRAGDKIIKIDDTPTMDLDIDEAVNLIRGEKGTTVRLTIIREDVDEPIEVEVVRDIIEIPTIKTEKREADGVFVITLYSFSAKAPYLFREALREFIESGYSRLIIDLRNNPGGYLEAAVDIASWFLPAGKVIVEEAGKNGVEMVYRSKGYNILNNNLKLAILVNQGSASASEILAGALSEHGKAILVGEKTFGKGSVQELINLPGKTSLKITVARWLTPNGKSISKNGLTPDIEVPFTKEDFDAGRDPQLERAIEALQK